MTWFETKLKENKDVANGLTPSLTESKIKYIRFGTDDVLTLATFIQQEDIKLGKFSLRDYLGNMNVSDYNELRNHPVVWGNLLKAMPEIVPNEKGNYIYGRKFYTESSLTKDQLLEYAVLYISGIHYQIEKTNITHYKQTIDYELMHDDSNSLASMIAYIANQEGITFLEAAQRTGLDFIEYNPSNDYILSRSENGYILWNKSSDCFEDNLALNRQQVIKLYERELLSTLNLKEEITYELIGD